MLQPIVNKKNTSTKLKKGHVSLKNFLGESVLGLPNIVSQIRYVPLRNNNDNK